MADRAKLGTDCTLLFHCPGCDEAHGVTVNKPEKWSWNGSLELPTISPSILFRGVLYGPAKVRFSNYKGSFPCESSPFVCHSFVRDGRIEFLPDCTHELAGQTVDLPEF